MYTKLLWFVILSGATMTYLIAMILLFDKLPSMNQMRNGINYGITVIQTSKYDYSQEINALKSIYNINESDHYDKLSFDVIKPWIKYQARLQFKQKLFNIDHKSTHTKYSPWNKKCPPDMQIKLDHDKQLNLNMYTPSIGFVNFTYLKAKFDEFVGAQHALSYEENKSNKCEYKGRVFGVGLFKTGTTSLNLALSYLGFIDNKYLSTTKYQHLKEYPCNYGHWYLILRHYYDLMNSLININNKQILHDIIQRSTTSYNFGDFPYLYFWRIFDVWYPSSKYILTIRSSTAKYVNSIMSFCIQIQECVHVTDINEYKWNKYDDINGMDIAHYIAMIYELHNERVIKYFDGLQTNNLLIINIDDMNTNQWKEMMHFLGCHNNEKTIIKHVRFPHLNPKLSENMSETIIKHVVSSSNKKKQSSNDNGNHHILPLENTKCGSHLPKKRSYSEKNVS